MAPRRYSDHGDDIRPAALSDAADRRIVVEQIVAFCREALEEGATPVLLGYSLGKAQEILCSLAEADLQPMLHGSVFRMTRIYEQFGQAFCEYERYNAGEGPTESSDLPAEREPFADAPRILKKARRDDERLGGGTERDLSLPGRRRLPLTDHADYGDLLRYVELVQTETRPHVARFRR